LEKLGMKPSGVHTTSMGLFFRDDQAFRAVAPPTYGPTGPYDSDRSIHQTHAHSRELRALLRYLELHAMLEFDRIDCFYFFGDKVCKRINSSSTQAISTYAMSVFKIPKQNCK
jgi:hypothetical protein